MDCHGLPVVLKIKKTIDNYQLKILFWKSDHNVSDDQEHIPQKGKKKK